jgi:hypothetical protein
MLLYEGELRVGSVSFILTAKHSHHDTSDVQNQVAAAATGTPLPDIYQLDKPRRSSNRHNSIAICLSHAAN